MYTWELVFNQTGGICDIELIQINYVDNTWDTYYRTRDSNQMIIINDFMRYRSTTERGGKLYASMGDNYKYKLIKYITRYRYNLNITQTQASQTITHEAPFTGEADEYSVGDPVFATGRACKYDRSSNEWTYETGPTDCICEVKPEGTVGEYVGICVGFNENTKSLIFATGGDYYFNVADSSKYKIGDVILLDGTVLKDEMALTGKVMKMIVGRVTAKINKCTVAVLKD